MVDQQIKNQKRGVPAPSGGVDEIIDKLSKLEDFFFWPALFCVGLGFYLLLKDNQPGMTILVIGISLFMLLILYKHICLSCLLLIKFIDYLRKRKQRGCDAINRAVKEVAKTNTELPNYFEK